MFIYEIVFVAEGHDHICLRGIVLAESPAEIRQNIEVSQGGEMLIRKLGVVTADIKDMVPGIFMVTHPDEEEVLNREAYSSTEHTTH